jgi:hypothetical protein
LNSQELERKCDDRILLQYFAIFSGGARDAMSTEQENDEGGRETVGGAWNANDLSVLGLSGIAEG